MQGCGRLGESGLGTELTWDARRFGTLKAKVLEKQGTDRFEIILARE